MSSLLTSFDTGVSGLNVAQVGLNTSAHNIANTSAKGYVRQQVIIADHKYSNSYDENNGLAQVGLGTHVSVILQRRSEFLDTQFREESGRLSFYEIRSETADEMEDLFGEMDGESFTDNLTSIWTAFQELSKMPDDITSREQLISEADSFLTRCKTLYGQIGEYQTNLNSQIKDIVKKVNDISEKIYNINSQIVFVEASGQQANDMYDARNVLLDELSEYVPVHTDHYANGVVTVSIEGIPLVSADNHYSMTTEQLTEGSPLLKPVWADNGGGDVFRGELNFSSEAGTDLGSLRSILTTRGSFAGKYTDVPTMPSEENYTDQNGVLDRTAYKIAMNSYDEQLKEYNTMVKPSIVVSMQVQLDTLFHGMATMINDVLCPNKEIEIVGEDGNPVKILVQDEDNAPVGCDGSIGNELFTRVGCDRYTKKTVTLTDGTEIQVNQYNEEDKSDYFSLYTLGQIEINPNVLKDSASLPLLENANSGYEGGYASTFLEKILDKWDDSTIVLDSNSKTYYNFNDFYSGMIGSLGTNGQVANNFIKSETTLVNSIDNQRQSLTGVSTDEELVDLVKFQHMYNACSRYITVIDEMLESLITNL